MSLPDEGMTPSLASALIEDVELSASTLAPYDRNARQHPAAQLDELASNLKLNGFTNPVIVDEDNMILSGHGRVEAARRAGIDLIPCRRVTGWSSGQKRAYIIWDNKSALKASWDDAILVEELEALRDIGLLPTTGFDQVELDMLANGWNPDIDVADKHGESLSGVATTIRVMVGADEVEASKEVMTKALEAAGITFEFA